MPNPGDYDNQDDFISACISERQDEHPGEDVDQSAAVCYSMWDDKAMNSSTIVHKTVVSKSDEMLSDGAIGFVLSDATPDRYGDIIDPSGWVLDNFKKNPIALFNHRSDFPIGRWENLAVKNGALRGQLRIAPEGTSERIDEIRALVNVGILRTVSVGFMPLESKALKNQAGNYVGEQYLKQELVETSLVSVPANPNAVIEAKRLKISADTCKMVFGQARQKEAIRARVGEDGTVIWQGQEVHHKRFVRDVWQGQKLYTYDR